MESCSNCDNCKLLWKLKRSNNLFAFLNEYCPVDVVLDNLYVVSKPVLKCTCCLLAHTLQTMSRKQTRKERVKKMLKKETIQSYPKRIYQKIVDAMCDFEQDMLEASDHIQAAFFVMILIVLALSAIIAFLSYMCLQF